MKFRKKKNTGRLIYSKGIILILLLLLVLVSKATWGVYEKHRETEKELGAAQASFEESSSREYVLEEKLETLETEKGIEREIRDTYGVAKEGEGVIIIVEDEEEVESPPPPEKESLWKTLFPFL